MKSKHQRQLSDGLSSTHNLRTLRGELLAQDKFINIASDKNQYKLTLYLLVDVLLISLSIFLAEFFSVSIVYLLAVMLIGARLKGLATIGVHDCTHGLLFERKKSNDIFALITCMLTFVPHHFYRSYKFIHTRHHRHVNTEQDPSLPAFIYLNDISNFRTMLLFLYSLSGLKFIKLQVIRSMTGSAWMHDAFSLLWLYSVLMLIAIGVYYDNYPAKLALFYWLIPLITWGELVNLFRLMAEHYNEGDYIKRDKLKLPELFRTRDIKPSLIDKLFTVTHNSSYHLTHHIYPHIPFYNLPMAHKELLKTSNYLKKAHYLKGYHSFFKEHFFERSVKPHHH